MPRWFSVLRRVAHAQAHDACFGADCVEMKTITPRKLRPFVQVKSADGLPSARGN